MASVDYMKVKTRAHLYNLIDHCSTETRLVGRHRNKHIDLTQTEAKNDQTCDAETARERFRQRIDELDNTTNRNKRKDRVEAFGLEIKPPPGIPPERHELWLEDVYELLEERIGAANVIAGYIHADEIHEYRDARTGRKRMSLPELHMYVIPEVKGQLNGRKFSSPSAMRQTNKAIEKMTLQRYGVPFLTGEEPEGGIPYGTSTADLKAESEIVQAIMDEHNGLMAQERQVVRQEAGGVRWAAEVDAQATREQADEYAWTTRQTAEEDADKARRDAEAAAEATRKAADEYAKRVREQADRDAEAVRLAVRAQLAAELDEAKAEYDSLQTARKTAIQALQGDMTAIQARQAQTAITAVLRAAGAYVPSVPKPDKLGPGMRALNALLASRYGDDSQGPAAPGTDGPTI